MERQNGNNSQHGRLSPVGGRAEASGRDLHSAGVQAADIYQHSMTSVRYSCRQVLMQVLEWEVPLLARIQVCCGTLFTPTFKPCIPLTQMPSPLIYQEATHSPFLDTYFNLVSLLGTHSSFLVCLPLLFWFGAYQTGLTMLFTLSAGCYCCSAAKDFFCVPVGYVFSLWYFGAY